MLLCLIIRTYQQRLPYELLSNLANSLLDDTIFEIVRGLKEIQQMTERQLIERRMKMINTHKGLWNYQHAHKLILYQDDYTELRNELLKKHREQLSDENVASPQIATSLLARQEKEREVSTTLNLCLSTQTIIANIWIYNFLKDFDKYLEDTETRLDMKIVMELDQTVRSRILILGLQINYFSH